MDDSYEQEVNKFKVEKRVLFWQRVSEKKGKRKTILTIEEVSVVIVIWVRTSCVLILRDAHFRMKITLRVVLIRSLVYAKRVPGPFRSGSGVARY